MAPRGRLSWSATTPWRMAAVGRCASLFLLLTHIISEYHALGFETPRYAFVGTPGVFRLRTGQNVTLTWSVDQEPPHVLNVSLWFSNQRILVSHNTTTADAAYWGRLSFQRLSRTQYQFTMYHVTPEDAGNYTFDLRTDLEALVDSSAVLFVFGTPSPPSISIQSESSDYVEGQPLALTCSAQSNSYPEAFRPPMTFTWSRNGKTIVSGDPPSRHSLKRPGRRRLLVSSARRDDVTYGCLAKEKGSVTSSQSELSVNVLYVPSPATLDHAPARPVTEGRAIDIRCSLADRGNPPGSLGVRTPTGLVIADDDGDGGVVIGNAYPSDHDGPWQCFGYNWVGEGEAANFTVHVKGKPYFVAHSARVKVQEHLAVVSWRLEGSVDVVVTDCCTSSQCTNHTADSSTSQPIRMPLPQGRPPYQFTFYLYQGDTVVNSYASDIQPETQGRATSQGVGVDNYFWIIVLSVVYSALLIIMAAGCLCLVRKKRRIYNLASSDSPQSTDNTQVITDEETSFLYRPDGYLAPEPLNHIPFANIDLENLAKDGAIFKVWSGTFLGGGGREPAFVKMAKAAGQPLCTGYVTGQVAAMRRVRHQHVIDFLGVTIGEHPDETDGEDYILTDHVHCSFNSLVLESAPLGNLNAYLTCPESVAYERLIPRQSILQMALCVASGAAVIAELQPEVLHYSLSTYHVLVVGETTCKVTGFADAAAIRARERWEADSMAERPVRWMAPELLRRLDHTAQADVWSFGVLLWELTTRGQAPFDVMSDEAVVTAVCAGNKLEKPRKCDSQLFDMMSLCWMDTPKNRPTFRQLLQRLTAMLGETGGHDNEQ